MPLPRKISTGGVEPSKSEAPPPSKPLYARVMDKLNRPGAIAAGGLSELLTSPSKRKTGVVERMRQNLMGERADDYDKLLEERGMGEGTTRAALGFAGDVVLDPLNWVPVGKIAKGLNAVSNKLGVGAKVTKALGNLPSKFSNYAGDIDDATKATLKLSDAAVSSLPDVLTTRLGRRAAQIKQANPALDAAGLRTALASQVSPTIYNEAKSKEIRRLVEGLLPKATTTRRVNKATQARLKLIGKSLTPADKAALRPILKGKAFPKDLANHLQRRIFDVESPTFVESSPLLRKIVKAPTDLFREAATVWRPKFHTSNAIGNVENIYKSGTTVPRMIKSAMSMRGFNKAFKNAANLTPAQVNTLIPGTNHTYGEAINAFEKYGLQHGIGDLTGITASNAGGTILDKTIDIAAKQAVGVGARLKDAVTQGSLGHRAGNVYRFIRDAGPKKFGDMIERNSKTLKYIDSLKQGKTPEQAVLDVQDTLFNYRDITPTERNIRDVMPFYTFSRKNLPLQAKSLLSSPKKWERIGDATNFVENATSNEADKMDSASTPTFLNDMVAPQMNQNSRGNTMFGTPNFAGQDINKLDVVQPLDAAKEWLGGLSPVAKAPIELPLNKTIFDNRQIYDPDTGPLNSYSKTPDAIAGLPQSIRDFITRDRKEMKYGKLTGKTINEVNSLAAYLAKQIPIGQTMGKVSLGVNDPEALSNRSALVSELTGAPIYEVTQESMKKQSEWQKRDEKRKETKRKNTLKRVTRSEGFQEALDKLGLRDY